MSETEEIDLAEIDVPAMLFGDDSIFGRSIKVNHYCNER